MHLTFEKQVWYAPEPYPPFTPEPEHLTQNYDNIPRRFSVILQGKRVDVRLVNKEGLFTFQNRDTLISGRIWRKDTEPRTYTHMGTGIKVQLNRSMSSDYTVDSGRGVCLTRLTLIIP